MFLSVSKFEVNKRFRSEKLAQWDLLRHVDLKCICSLYLYRLFLVFCVAPRRSVLWNPSQSWKNLLMRQQLVLLSFWVGKLFNPRATLASDPVISFHMFPYSDRTIISDLISFFLVPVLSTFTALRVQLSSCVWKLFYTVVGFVVGFKRTPSNFRMYSIRISQFLSTIFLKIRRLAGIEDREWVINDLQQNYQILCFRFLNVMLARKLMQNYLLSVIWKGYIQIIINLLNF